MPKKIKSEDFDMLPLYGKGRTSPVYNSIVSLQPGDSIVITKAEWKPATYTPLAIVNRIERKYGMKFIRGALTDRSGWAVKRVK